MNRFRKKAVEPLIAAILLIVVAVILVTIVLSWGKMFTTEATNKVKVAELTQSDAESFIYPNSLKNGMLQFNYSPPQSGNFGELIINSYMAISDSGESSDKNITPNYTLKQGTNIISLNGFEVLGIPSSSKATIILKTTSNQYISIKNITNQFTAPPVALPYIMYGRSRLFIQPDQNATEMDWAAAVAYCEDLDSEGYEDWYLPSADQLLAIWLSCPENKTVSCMNTNINKDNYSGDWVDFFSAVGYWSNTLAITNQSYTSFYLVWLEDLGFGLADNQKTTGLYVRCVRGP